MHQAGVFSHLCLLPLPPAGHRRCNPVRAAAPERGSHSCTDRFASQPAGAEKGRRQCEAHVQLVALGLGVHPGWGKGACVGMRLGELGGVSSLMALTARQVPPCQACASAEACHLSLCAARSCVLSATVFRLYVCVTCVPCCVPCRT